MVFRVYKHYLGLEKVLKLFHIRKHQKMEFNSSKYFSESQM